MPSIKIPDGILRSTACTISRVSGNWPWEEHNRDAIAAHWHRRAIETPAFFNGRVHIMVSGTYNQTTTNLSGHIVETDFASSLYWRESGYQDRDVVDCFCAALLTSSDGALIYGRQSKGNVNQGLTYPPSGFIDRRDIRADDILDIESGILRELTEETGLNHSALSREPGYVISRSGPLLCIGVHYRAEQSAAELTRDIHATLANQSNPELEAAVALHQKSDAALHPMPPYARQLAETLLTE